MRPVGTRRGNTMVRTFVDQAARRRLWASLAPSQVDEEAPSSDQWSVRWTRRFYDHVRRRLVPRMTPIERTSDGELRWWGGDDVRLWALVDVDATVLALEHGETSESLLERARRWSACLATRTAPGLASPHWGHPVYGARLDLRNGELDVVWAVPGDWCAIVMAPSPPSATLPVPAFTDAALARA